MLGEILVSLLISGAVIALIWFLKGKLLTPVPMGAGQSITVVLKVTGSARELEQTVKGLLWLDQNGTLPMEVVISDNGMDDSARQVAKTLVGKNEKVRLSGWYDETKLI